MKNIYLLALVSISLLLVACGSNKVLTQAKEDVKTLSSFPIPPITYATWLKQFGDSTKIERLSKVIVDKNDDIYVVGTTFAGDITDSGKFATKIGITGNSDMFIVKYNKFGTKLWAYQIGTDLKEEAFGAATDLNGNVCVVGNSFGDFAGPAKSVFQGAVICFDKDGNEYSRATFGTVAKGMRFSSADFDSSGNLYISGWDFTYEDFRKEALIGKFDPMTKSFSYTAFGGPKASGFQDIKLDSSGNIYVSGLTDGNLYEPNKGGRYDAFVAKYDSSLTFKWGIQRDLSTSDEDRGNRITLDSAGNVFLASNRQDSVTSTWIDGSVSKIDSSGKLIWKETKTDANLFDVGVSSTGNIYAAGSISGNLLIFKLQDKGMTADVLTPLNFHNPSSFDTLTSIALDGSGTVYVAGETQHGLSTTGSNINDIFLFKTR